MLRHMEVYVKAYGNVIYIYIYIYMHMLRHYGNLKMCKECICIFSYICVLMIK